MASAPSPNVAPSHSNPPHPIDALPPDQALFTLLTPITAIVEGAEIEISGFGMRAIGAPDLPLLDQHRGQVVALAQNVIAALCDLTLDQVRQLHIEDFAMLASEALFQVEQISAAMGLPAGFFLEQGVEEAAA